LLGLVLNDLVTLLTGESSRELKSDDVLSTSGVSDTNTQLFETGLEDVFSMTSVANSIVNNEFNDGIFGSSSERSSLDDVFTNSGLPITEFFKSVTHGRSSLSSVSQSLLVQKIDRVLESSEGHTVGKSQQSLWLGVLQVFNSFLHSW